MLQQLELISELLAMRDFGFVVCILAFAVNHAFSYSHQRQEDWNRTPKLVVFLLYPGLRLVPVYIAFSAEISGDYSETSQNLSLLQFLILPITVDVISHFAQHSAR